MPRKQSSATPKGDAQPLKTGLQPVSVRGPGAPALLRALIYCTEEKDPADPLMRPISKAAASAKADPAWHYFELPTGHLPWETMPERLAEVLVEVAGYNDAA